MMFPLLNLCEVENYERGDVIYIEDAAKETKHTFFIEGVTSRSETYRELSVRVIKSNELKFNSFHKLPLDSSVPVFGRIKKKGDIHRQDFEPLQWDNLVTNEIRMYLDLQHKYNYGAPIKEVVRYLQENKFLDEDPVRARRQVLNVYKKHLDLFYQKGGWLYSQAVPYEAPDKVKHMAIPGVPRRHVRMHKLIEGIRNILESGILGDVMIDE